MSELYFILVALVGKTEVDNFCQNVFWTPKSRNERVIEACEGVWEEVYFYNQK